MHDDECRFVGWLIRDKGLEYLATMRGWFVLEDLPRNQGSEVPAVVTGARIGPTTIRVSSIRTHTPASARPDGGRPLFASAPVPQLVTSSLLRGKAAEWLRSRGYLEVPLPTLWARSEEYGREEFSVTHSEMSGLDLRLLQSSEFALYTAMAEGLESTFTFGRCYRLENSHDEEHASDYLAEFEQLVISQSFVTLAEAIATAQELVCALAAEVGITLTPDSFRMMAPPGVDEVASGADLVIENLTMFTFPPTWSPAGREVMLRRLNEFGANVMRLDGPTGAAKAGEPGETVRIAIEVPAKAREQVQRIIDIAGDYVMPGEDVATMVAMQLNPTWNAFPPLAWRDDEVTDSAYPVRSISSRRVVDADGEPRIADAELYLGGTEIVHIRAYADREQFGENLRLAGIPDVNDRYGYLLESLAGAPPGMTGIFIGWERLNAVLTGSSGAVDSQLLPRTGQGFLVRACGPHEHRAQRRKGRHASA